jgi:glycosyltransferase involved in cell wall biosynthesis
MCYFNIVYKLERNKNLLIVSEVPTHQPFAGNRSCILSYSEMLKGMGYNVYFLFYYGEGFSVVDLNLTREFWNQRYFSYKISKLNQYKRRLLWALKFKFLKINYLCVDDFYPSGIEKKVRKIIKDKNISIVLSNYIWTTKLFTQISGVRKILYTHDVFSYRFERTNMNFFSTTPCQEAKALNRCDAILSIQETESQFFRYITKKPVISGFSPIKTQFVPLCFNKNILFIAGLNPLNIDGITNFINDVFPRLFSFDPEIKLLIGGRICSVLNHLETINVRLLGDIECLEEFYSLGDIVINPVSYGTGLKIKTIEALSFGRAVVCHPHSVVGLYNLNMIPLITAENPDEYFEGILSLLLCKDKVVEFYNLAIQYVESYNKNVKSMFNLAFYGSKENE